MTSDELTPLGPGMSGDAVRELQSRLKRGGFLGLGESSGTFDAPTQLALLAFQDRSGLAATGICDGPTWAALVESGYKLGDRLLYRRSPMLRGDDVAALQHRLSELGFQRGRVDGIFGPETESAVISFQRNTGLVTDGVAGPDVVAQLRRLGPGAGKLTKASLSDRLDLKNRPTHLAGTRIALAEPGTLPAFLRALTLRLEQSGAATLAIHHPEGATQAAEANQYEAQCFLGWTSSPQPGVSMAYYQTDGFVSAGGKQLAETLSRTLEGNVDGPLALRGMRIPVLRETRMPALWITIGPPSWIVTHAPQVTIAVLSAIREWLAAPVNLGAHTLDSSEHQPNQ